MAVPWLSGEGAGLDSFQSVSYKGRMPSARTKEFILARAREIVPAVMSEQDRAQLHEAEEAWSAMDYGVEDAVAIRCALEVLRQSPFAADAYTILADRMPWSIAERLQILSTATRVARLACEKRLREPNSYWFMEVRAYYRARFNLAEVLWEAGCVEEALAHFQALRKIFADIYALAYCFACHVCLARWDKAEAIVGRKPNDEFHCAEFDYGRVLLFWLTGRHNESRKAMQDAFASNPFVPEFLRAPETASEWGSYQDGSPEQAQIYVRAFAMLWDRVPQAKKALLDAARTGTAERIRAYWQRQQEFAQRRDAERTPPRPAAA